MRQSPSSDPKAFFLSFIQTDRTACFRTYASFSKVDTAIRGLECLLLLLSSNQSHTLFISASIICIDHTVDIGVTTYTVIFWLH